MMNPTRIALPTGLSTRMIDTGGEGAPILLLHGLAASIEIWEAALPLLAEKRRVIAFDLPGFGESDKPDAAYDAPFFIRQVIALMDALGIDQADMVGSSLGASLVVRLNAAHPGRVRRAVLAAPGGFGSGVHLFLRIPTLPLIGYAMARPMRATNAFAVKLAMAEKKHATRDLIDLADRMSKLPGAHRAFHRTLNAVIAPGGVKDLDIFASEAGQLACPTLLVWGKQDRLFNASQSDAAMRSLPNAKRVLLDRCGHYPQVEAAARFAQEVLAHLA